MFIGRCGGALRYIAVKETFDRLVGKAGSCRRRNAVPVYTICGTRSRCGRCRAVRPDEVEAVRIWWRSRPTWGTSTSTRPIGTGGHRRPLARRRRGRRRLPLRRGAIMTPIAPLIETFLRETLASQRGASQHTRSSTPRASSSLHVRRGKAEGPPIGADVEQIDAASSAPSSSILKICAKTRPSRATFGWQPSSRSSASSNTGSRRPRADTPRPGESIERTNAWCLSHKDELQAVLDAPGPDVARWHP